MDPRFSGDSDVQKQTKNCLTPRSVSVCAEFDSEKC